MGREVGDCLILSLTLLFLLLASGCTSSAMSLDVPRPGLLSRRPKDLKTLTAKQALDTGNNGFQFFNYTQTRDHFSFGPGSNSTFQQSYAINSDHWGGANTSSPIFAYIGDEGGGLSGDLAAGFFIDITPRFKALLVFMEHRYYGQSMPFGSVEDAYKNTSTLGYFTAAQALADYAELLVNLKKNLSAESSPTIAFGGSYGGMLASWFRLKYPHIAIGALASSAPILYFEDLTPQDAYYTVVTKDFRETSESCYQTIKQSWLEIDKIAAKPNGLSILSQKFNTCSPLNNSEDLKNLLVKYHYSLAAQYDDPFTKPVSAICNEIDGAPKGTDVLGRVIAGVSILYANQCLGISSDLKLLLFRWTRQTCTDMVIPMAPGRNSTMFQARPFDLDAFIRKCQQTYGVTPPPHWITTEFGGHHIKSVLKRFGSNIIFSNGLRDPFSSGGVLYNISESIVALYTTQGSHTLDLVASTAQDPDWLVSQRNAEIKIMKDWLEQYYADNIQ